MISVYKEAEITIDEMLHTTHVKLGTNKGQGCIQNNLDMTIIDNNSFDVNGLAYCKHIFVVPIGMDIGELTKYNSKVAKEHHTKMKKWSHTTTKRICIKPCPGKSMSWYLACGCAKMNCLHKTIGLGCIKYKIACDNTNKQGSDVCPFCM